MSYVESYTFSHFHFICFTSFLLHSVHVGSGHQHCGSKSLLCAISSRSKRKYDPFQEDQLLLLQGKLLLYIQRHSGDRYTLAMY